MSAFVDEFMAQVKAKNPGEPEFHQAVEEVVESVDAGRREPTRRIARRRSSSGWSSPSA